MVSKLLVSILYFFWEQIYPEPKIFRCWFFFFFFFAPLNEMVPLAKKSSYFKKKSLTVNMVTSRFGE